MKYIETIRLENGMFHLLDLHQQRMARTIREVYGDDHKVPDLKRSLESEIKAPDSGLYKCRVIYDTEIRGMELLPYRPRMVKSLKVIEAMPGLDYHLKSTDRSALTLLSSEKGQYDEVIIIRDGLITDTSYTNLIFRGREGLLTPRLPLLKGVMRQSLINRGLITEANLTLADISPGNVAGITEAIMINAMLPLETAPVIPLSGIIV